MNMIIAATWDGLPIPPEQQVQLSLERGRDVLTMRVDAPFYQDPPPPHPAGPCPELWNYEVVELFIAHGLQYTEIELAPRGQHWVLQLQGIRQPIAEGLAIAYAAEIVGSRWHGVAQVPVALVPPEPWTWNAYAIHGQGIQRRYLSAHAVPGAEPDFHRLHCFAPWVGNEAVTPVNSQSSSQ
jgi:hypothetical protein